MAVEDDDYMDAIDVDGFHEFSDWIHEHQSNIKIYASTKLLSTKKN